jgi:hypothetical protein
MYEYGNYRHGGWKNALSNLKTSRSTNEAYDVIWDMWNNPENKSLKFLPTKELLILSLEKNNSAIGTSNPFASITHESTPIYATWNNWWYNYDDIWYIEKWKHWYDVLALYYGHNEAKQRFLLAWNYTDNWTSWGAWGWDMCKDCDFIEYMATKNINVACSGATTLCNLSEIGTSTIETLENVAETTSNLTGLINNLLPIITLVGGGLFLYDQIKKRKKNGQ